MKFVLPVILFFYASAALTATLATPENRIASIFVSQDFINEQLALHSKSELIKELKLELDHELGQIFLRGIVQIPVEELRAINLDPKLGAFRFQATIKPEVSQHGHLILDFPLAETFFYPASSGNTKRDRVIVPVQMLSLALASARGYLAALSGDFSSFDRRTAKLSALLKALDHSISREKNADALEELKTQRESLHLQIAAVPIERKQLQKLSQDVAHLLGFSSEKELNINDELAARKNALILKVKLSQLAPYLKGVELGGVRILHDKKDGSGENYLAIDVNSQLAITSSAPAATTTNTRAAMKVAPSLVMRLNQSLFESDAVVSAEKLEMSSKLRNLSLQLREDGLHVSGSWRAFLFSVPFETIVDFVTTQSDVFEVRVRKLEVAGLDFEFMQKIVLESLQKRLDDALKGICSFQNVGLVKNHSQALQVTVTPKALVPAFPELHLVDVDIRDREFLLKIGRNQ